MWLWKVADWTPAGQPLEAHSLTVTQMAFSSTGHHLLTVSRDRTFAVWERQSEGARRYKRVLLSARHLIAYLGLSSL